MSYILCETIAAVVIHLREKRGNNDEPKIGGHRFDGENYFRPKTICGMDAAWDKNGPKSDVTCSECKELSGQ